MLKNLFPIKNKFLKQTVNEVLMKIHISIRKKK